MMESNYDYQESLERQLRERLLDGISPIKGIGLSLLSYLAAVALLAAIILLTSCKSSEVVTVPEYHEVVNVLHDTVKEKDSVYHERTVMVREADSATLAEYGIRLANAERAWLVERDQLMRSNSGKSTVSIKEIVKTDSIPVPYPVERKLSKWERFCIDYGKITLGGSIAAVITIIILIIMYIHRKSQH